MSKKVIEENLDSYQGGLAYFIAIAVFVLVVFIGQTVCSAVFEQGSAGYIAISSTFSIIAFGIVTFYFSKRVKKPVQNLLSVKPFKPIYILFAVILSCAMFFGLGFLNTAFVTLLKNLGVKISPAVVPLNNAWQLLLFIFTLAILPSIAEELFFRGVLLTSLSKVKTLVCLVIVGGCFALYHGSVQQFLYQFIYGVMLALLVKASGSVIPAIISHFINNFVVLLLEYLKVQIDLFNPVYIVIGLILLAVFIAFNIMAIKKNSLVVKKSEKGAVKDFFLPCGIFGMAICLTLIISSLFVGA